MNRMCNIISSLFVAVIFLADNANGSLLLSVRGPGGENHLALNPGQEIQLTIRLTALSPFVLYNGGDFTINSGSDSTFQQAIYDLNGAGGWASNPPQGGTSRFFTGGPAGTHIFFNAGDSLQLGRIVFRQGNTPGIYSTSFTDVLQLDSAFLPIPVQTSNFTYGVPEPSSVALVGLIGLGCTLVRRRCSSLIASGICIGTDI